MYRIVIILGFIVAIAGLIISMKKVKSEGRTLWGLPDSGFTGLVSLLLLIALATLVVTGFLPVIITGGPVSGLILILHVAAGPVFAMCLAFLAITLAAKFRMQAGDAGHRVKWAFWLVLLFAIPLISSAILTMFPIFGTEGQHLLLHLHGYSALLLLLTIGVTYYLSQTAGDEPKES